MSQRNYSTGILPVRPQLVSSGERLSLADWLQLSWFFPRGFRRERVIETAHSYVVVGQSVVYKFRKETPDYPPAASFVSRWRAASREVLLNRELAPDLYLGLRLLRLVDDEPFWITELRPGDAALEDADEAAIVMRRIPAKVTLADRLTEEAAPDDHSLKLLVKLLSRFYRHRMRAGIQACAENPNAAVEWIRAAVLDRLILFIEKYGSFLDPFSRIAFQEAKAYLSGFFTDHQQLFIERGRTGKVLECHGALCADHILTRALTPGGRPVSIFGRRESTAATADVLSDIASLTVDLESRGARQLARCLEQRFFGENPEFFDDALYRFYRTAAAALRAGTLFYGETGDYAIEATNCAAIALREALGINRAFLVAVGGPADGGGAELVSSVAELSGAARIEPSNLPSAGKISVDLDELLFEELLDTLRPRLRTGEPLVVRWPFNREEERLRIAAEAKAAGVPCLLVKCCRSIPEYRAPGRAAASTLTNEPDDHAKRASEYPARRLWGKQQLPWPPPPPGYSVHQLYLEPIIAQPELALQVLRSLHAPGAGNPSGA